MDIFGKRRIEPGRYLTAPGSMSQTWHNLLFAHWRSIRQAFQAVVPCRIDHRHLGRARWLGIVVFRLSGIRLRGCPPVPLVAAFPKDQCAHR